MGSLLFGPIFFIWDFTLKRFADAFLIYIYIDAFNESTLRIWQGLMFSLFISESKPIGDKRIAIF